MLEQFSLFMSSRLLPVAAAAFFIAPPDANSADSSYWGGVGPGGVWSDNGSWLDVVGSPGHPPVNGDFAYLNKNPNTFLSFDIASISLGSMWIDNGDKLLQSQGTFITQTETVGGGGGLGISPNKNGAVIHQIGTPTKDGFLYIGTASEYGDVTISPGSSTVTLTTYGKEEVGHDGQGTFDQESGTHTVGGTAGLLSIGWDNNVGEYDFNGGNLNVDIPAYFVRGSFDASA